MNLRQDLTTRVSTAIETLFGAIEGLSPSAREVIPSDRPDLADYQCNVAMALGKRLGQPPRAVAEKLAAALREDFGATVTVDVAGPGFVNLRLADSFLRDAARVNLPDARQGLAPVARSRKIIVDFGGPNIAKELHIGHLRPHLIGDALQHLFRFMGDEVLSDIHMGDWGTPIGMIIAQLASERPDLSFFADAGRTDPAFTLDIEELGALYRRSKVSWDEGDAFKEKARLATEALQSGKKPGYRALWQLLRTTSLADVQKIYDRLNIRFDLFLGESDVNDVLPPMLDELVAKGFAVRDAGAVIIPAARLGFKEDAAPILLQKSDGAYTYAATDLATIKERVEKYGAESIVYIVDNRQKQHFEQVFAAARLVGYAPVTVELIHAGNGTINGKDGRPFKTRDGQTVRMKDVLDIATDKARAELPDPSSDVSAEEIAASATMIGMAAVKFQEYMNLRLSDYIFDMDHFTSFEGKTGPYLQYAQARCNALLAKADSPASGAEAIVLSNKVERDLLLHLLRFPEAVVAARAKFEPSFVAQHAYKLAQLFSAFYTQSPVLAEKDPALRAARLAFVQAVAQQEKLCFHLLNMASPDRMLRRTEEQTE
jgi:arginyl-tRNA synthetase